MKNKKIWVFLIFSALILILARYFNLGSYLFEEKGINTLKNIINENYILAAGLYIVFTAAACVLLALPGLTFAVAAGILFGPWAGSILCLAGTTLGAVLSFAAGRYFLKDAVKPMIEKNKLLKKVIFTDKPENEIILLMITRLLPVFPFNLQNFAYGITDISIVKYTMATFIFMIPGVLLFTLATSGIINETERADLFFIVLIIAAVMVLLSVYVKRIYKKINSPKEEAYEK
ncbi:TVP38/TMEM64 family protein [Anaeropeptidivorans aminofermentans]|uniref:TVP38/TMEM64 family protein n=1 Tax=Anaeropeptidivorans aminofermentans TaxID=2934315 RepID=UPI0020251057|nr:TVP38/TMEM64 family protein [Anaeropeptidivorans aminofermentans]MBE6012257.1 TVP38/TMEM64 family protein [Lachnospiraceae bacterium]